MKKVNFNFGILALVMGLALAFVTSAFTAEPANTTTSWFEYDSVGPIDDPTSYDKMDDEPLCNASDALCAIQATVDGEDPVIDSTLESEINAALSNPSSPHPNVRLFE